MVGSADAAFQRLALGKISSDDILKYFFFFLFFTEDRIRHFMQIVCKVGNLLKMSNPVFLEKRRKNVINRRQLN